MGRIHELKIGSQVEFSYGNSQVTHLPGQREFKGLDYSKVEKLGRFIVDGLYVWVSQTPGKYGLVSVPIDSVGKAEVEDEICEQKKLQILKFISIKLIIDLVLKSKKCPTVLELYNSSELVNP